MNCWFHHNVTWSNLKDTQSELLPLDNEINNPSSTQCANSVNNEHHSKRYSINIIY